MNPQSNVAETQAIALPEAEPRDLAACFTDRHGLDLVVEMAHDLRSPLTSILFLAEALQRGHSGVVNETQRRQLGLIRSAALGLCAAASDVLEMTRGGNRLVQREATPFSISDVLASVRDLVTPLAEEKGLDLRFLAPELGERVGHERAVARVLLNLTTNALKYTDQGLVEVAARETGESRIEFSVRDTGPGMDPEAVRALYQPFPQRASGLGAGGQYFSSSGLGLAICRKLVTALGSELTVRTWPGGGTRFAFEIDLPPAPRFA
ncbi:MAG TPA: HAMP domain-containing sensor histidine kinase [Gemmatimonadales bacterium]|jgi:signal transduction histidine kinase|nr:HAMP domain-containing sensor histidine kinase [Gemmatimonadales bacterium]